MKEEKIVCPNCHSEQLTANPRGFSTTNAVIGMVSGEGMVSGMIGSGRIIITCLKCGYRFRPGEGALKGIDEHNNETIVRQKPKEKDNSAAIIIFLIIALVAFLMILFA